MPTSLQRIKSASKALLPNIVWDAIKFFFNNWHWIVGVAVSGTGLTTYWNYFQGVSSGFWAVILLALIWLVGLTITSFVSRRKGGPPAYNLAGRNHSATALEPIASDLEILFEPKAPYIEESSYRHFPPDETFTYDIVRFAIRNTNEAMTAKGVRATLICDWEVFGKTFDGEALRPMREFGKDFDGTFDINPGVTKFVDIAVRRVVTQGMNGHEFDTHLRIAPADRAAFHIGTHEIIGLTIQVSAHDHPPQIIRFDLYYEPIRQFFDVAVIQKRLRGRLSAKQDDEPAEVKPYQLPY